MDFGAVRVMGMLLMEVTREGLEEEPFLQEQCIRSNFLRLKVMPINSKRLSAW